MYNGCQFFLKKEKKDEIKGSRRKIRDRNEEETRNIFLRQSRKYKDESEREKRKEKRKKTQEKKQENKFEM